jgi:hypothetical protein
MSPTTAKRCRTATRMTWSSMPRGGRGGRRRCGRAGGCGCPGVGVAVQLPNARRTAGMRSTRRSPFVPLRNGAVRFFLRARMGSCWPPGGMQNRTQAWAPAADTGPGVRASAASGWSTQVLLGGQFSRRDQLQPLRSPVADGRRPQVRLFGHVDAAGFHGEHRGPGAGVDAGLREPDLRRVCLPFSTSPASAPSGDAVRRRLPRGTGRIRHLPPRRAVPVNRLLTVAPDRDADGGQTQ